MQTHNLSEDAYLRQHELALLEEKNACSEMLRKHDESLAHHRQILNSRRPIGRLPVEILLAIFVSCIKDAPLKRHGSRDPWEGVRLTHVCSRWRSAAISFPFLWDSVDLSWPAWTKELIMRSQEALLTITYTSRLTRPRREDTFNKPITNYVFKHRARRIVYLHICTPRVQLRQLYHTFPLHMPALRVVILSNGTSFNPSPTGLPWPSFMSHANDLRYFHLDGEWAVDSPLSLFCPSLLSLKLQLSKIRPNLSLREVTGALTCMTSLKYLSLSSIFDFRNPFQANSVSLPIHLPQLVHLTVSGSVANSAALLKHLKLVSLTSLRVNAMGYDSFLEVNSLCSVVADTIEGSPLFPSLARINLTHRRGMKELNAGESDSVCSKPHRFSQPRSLTFLHVHIHNLAIDFPNDVDLTALISRLNLSKLQQLDLDITMPCPSIAIFSRLTTVTTLRIWGETLMDLPMIMSFQSITAFPALKRLEIRHVVADDDPETVQYESCPNELHEVFKLRRQDSSTPFELCFGQCIYPPQEICEAIIAGIFSAYENCIQPGGTRIDAQALNNVSMICDASGHAVRKEDFTWMEDWTNIMMVSSITFKFQATQD